MAKKTVRMHVKNGYVIVDAADLEFLSEFPWSLNKKGYARFSVWIPELKTKKTVMIHQMLMGYKPGLVIDHIDRNPRNNSRSNLRWATYAENFWNSNYGDKIKKRLGLEE
jgi:hypothetical protein